MRKRLGPMRVGRSVHPLLTIFIAHGMNAGRRLCRLVQLGVKNSYQILVFTSLSAVCRVSAAAATAACNTATASPAATHSAGTPVFSVPELWSLIL